MAVVISFTPQNNLKASHTHSKLEWAFRITVSFAIGSPHRNVWPTISLCLLDNWTLHARICELIWQLFKNKFTHQVDQPKTKYSIFTGLKIRTIKTGRRPYVALNINIIIILFIIKVICTNNTAAVIIILILIIIIINIIMFSWRFSTSTKSSS